MRRLFVILSLFVAIVAMAGPVDKKQAMQEAAAFLKDHPLTVDNKADGQAQTAESVRLTDVSATLPMGEKAPFYIINIGDQQGFVIVSGDDRTNPILGYSDEGAFDAKPYACEHALLARLLCPATQCACRDGRHTGRSCSACSATRQGRHPQLHRTPHHDEMGPGDALLERMSAVHELRR